MLESAFLITTLISDSPRRICSKATTLAKHPSILKIEECMGLGLRAGNERITFANTRQEAPTAGCLVLHLLAQNTEGRRFSCSIL